MIDLYYTGVGSRQTPSMVMAVQTQLAHRLWGRGFVLRSGAALGSDQAFEAGAPVGAREIYVPWKPFERNLADYMDAQKNPFYEQAREIAASLHPNWNAPGMLRGNAFGQKAHTRNVFQVLGADLQTPSSFLICWAPWAKTWDRENVKGGTNTAVRLALRHNIPVFNLVDDEQVWTRVNQRTLDALTKLVLELAPAVLCKVCGEPKDEGNHGEDGDGEFPAACYEAPEFTLTDALECHRYEPRVPLLAA